MRRGERPKRLCCVGGLVGATEASLRRRPRSAWGGRQAAQLGRSLLAPVVYVALIELGKLLDRRAGRHEPAPASATT